MINVHHFDLCAVKDFGKTNKADNSLSQVTLHVAFVHAFVNPTLFLVLHKGLRKATLDLLCCNFRSSSPTTNSGNGGSRSNLRGSTRNLENITGNPALDSRGNMVAVQEGMPIHNSRTYM